MKTQTKLLAALGLLITFASGVTHAQNSCTAPGGDKGNGGFRDSEGTGVMLKDAKKSLQQEMANLLKNRSNLVYQSELCPKEIGLEKLAEMVDNVTYSPLAEPTIGRNADNIDEARWFQINAQGHVEATKRFFDLFHGIYTVYYEGEKDSAAKEKLLKPVRLGIVHESLHDFGYNQALAKACAPDMISLIESYNPEKLKALIRETENENDVQLAEFLESSKCLTEKAYQEARYNYSALSTSSRAFDFQYLVKSNTTRGLFGCILKLGYTKKVNPSDSIQDMLNSLSNGIFASKSKTEVSRALQRHLKFDFLKPLPTQK